MKYYVRTTLERKLHSSYNQIEYTLLIDKEHKPVESFFDQLELISDDDAVLLEDDLVLCDNFKEIIEEMISKHPNDIINFFQDPYDFYTPHYVRKFSWNQCTYYPKGVGKKISTFIKDYWTKFPRVLNYQYDRLESIAIEKLYLLVWLERPSPIQHIDNAEYKTLIQKEPICERRTPFYIDYLKELNIKYEDSYKEENLKQLNKMRIQHFRNKD